MDNQYYRVEFDFIAGEAVEMSVKKDDIVVSAPNPGADQSDEWLYVAKVDDPSQTGFIPVSYAQELSSSEVASLGLDSGSAAPLTASLLAGPSGSPMEQSGMPANFSDMFSRHQAYFEQVVRQREASFKKLETALTSAASEITQCQERNAKLSQQIVALDNMIEEERRKWRERLESEKKGLFASILS
eukprot:gnl/Ergobibamus_cyprinoides/1703.p1 GENE.gnl/Ergobibamus_cyprinoides/1703~~gnl/Ergobibamus_cyprinoides/1703.p1  ORF type:complete len:187 (+),score=63.49 gnl/Ergobibamus_cyprinoides/1703:129-689(+)